MKKVSGGTTTLYLVSTVNPSGYAQVMEELTVNGSTTNLGCAYVYGLDLLSQRQPTVTTNFYGYDGLGSVRFLLNLAGGLAGTNTFDAWGNLIASTGTITNRYLFAGEQWDADLGLYYNRARYWSPNVGRFWTMDCFEGNSQDPLSLHKYLYGADNPVNNIDPSGHEFTIAGVSLGAAWNVYWRAGIANVSANLVLSTLLNQKYSASEGAWDFATGGLMGGGSLVVSSAAKALSAKIGGKVIATAVFQFGPPAVNAAISTGEWVIKKNVVQHQDVSLGEVMWVFGLTTTANYVLHQGALMSEQKRESARRILEGLEQLRNGTAPRGFGSFRHLWSGMNPQTRKALEKWAEAVESNADLPQYIVIMGDISEALVGEVAEQIGDEFGDN